MKVINTEKKPIKLWLDNIEDGALEQARNLANLPFTYKWVSIMPDSHQGYGMPIGGVLATEGVIIPNAVGVDIGCGMCATKTNLKEIGIEILKKIMGEIRLNIPVGFNWHKEKQYKKLPIEKENTEVIEPQKDRALQQVGTLGGGNHFIEIQQDAEGFIWIMIHSGSRNLGHTVASYYNNLAVKLNERWRSEVPKHWELAFLPIEEASNYIKDMNYCVAFALENRKLMMQRACESIAKFKNVNFDPMINIPHNYAALEKHYGRNVWVHRKGSTLAREGTIGIIPGSQGTRSYIVEGKGNKESFESCSHGSGRKMGRKEAQRSLDLEEEKKKLEDLGVIHAIRGVKDLDEAPGSYKDISEVMNNQTDLVSIKVELKPLAVVKG